MLNKVSSIILGGVVLSLCAERSEAFWQNVVEEFKSSDVRLGLFNKQQLKTIVS